jgi:transcriptional regulator with XRE-family HTH domain
VTEANPTTGTKRPRIRLDAAARVERDARTKQIIALRRAGHTAREIASIFGVSRPLISRILCAAGLKSEQATPPAVASKIIQLRATGKSLSAVAAATGVSVCTVRKVAVAHGVHPDARRQNNMPAAKRAALAARDEKIRRLRVTEGLPARRIAAELGVSLRIVHRTFTRLGIGGAGWRKRRDESVRRMHAQGLTCEQIGEPFHMTGKWVAQIIHRSGGPLTREYATTRDLARWYKVSMSRVARAADFVIGRSGDDRRSRRKRKIPAEKIDDVIRYIRTNEGGRKSERRKRSNRNNRNRNARARAGSGIDTGLFAGGRVHSAVVQRRCRS